jgi:hypothetical protein
MTTQKFAKLDITQAVFNSSGKTILFEDGSNSKLTPLVAIDWDTVARRGCRSRGGDRGCSGTLLRAD